MLFSQQVWLKAHYNRYNAILITLEVCFQAGWPLGGKIIIKRVGLVVVAGLIPDTHKPMSAFQSAIQPGAGTWLSFYFSFTVPHHSICYYVMLDIHYDICEGGKRLKNHSKWTVKATSIVRNMTSNLEDIQQHTKGRQTNIQTCFKNIYMNWRYAQCMINIES